VARWRSNAATTVAATESTPQKLVHLVGYRDPKAQPEPWVRPGPLQMKQ
jgi:hypothetical protein